MGNYACFFSDPFPAFQALLWPQLKGFFRRLFSPNFLTKPQWKGRAAGESELLHRFPALEKNNLEENFPSMAGLSLSRFSDRGP